MQLPKEEDLNKIRFLLAMPLLAAATFADAPDRVLDAGTWVRPSFTVVPAAVGECPSEEVFLRRAWRRLNAEFLLPARLVARAEAAQEHAYCLEARRSLAGSLSGDWSGLLSMSRFDRNDLPPAEVDTASGAGGLLPWREVGPVLDRHLGGPLRELLSAKALERSSHLSSSQQQNSSVATKMRTQDVTDDELSLVRNSAHLLMLRVGGLDVARKGKELRFLSDFSCAMWSFDPVARSFRPEGTWTASSTEDGDPGNAGAQAARTARGFSSAILDLPAFRFTTQILSAHEGNWLNPASNFTTNTGADLRLNRRFRYFENRVDRSGNTVSVPAGWGYLDDHSQRDSLWRLRHVGGIRPYTGLVLEEVPGDGWGFLSLTQVGARTTGGVDLSSPRPLGRFVDLRSSSPQWELRLGGRAPLGSSHSFLTLDIPFLLGDVHGALADDFGPIDSLHRYQDRRETSLLLGWGLEVGWAFRHNIRRLFWEAGIQAGFRSNTVWLSDEVTTAGRMSPDETALSQDQAQWLRNFEGTVTLHTGASWSLTPWSGLGVQLNWDWLDGRSDWEVGTGKDFTSADWNSVPGRVAGTSRLRLLFQYMWK